MGYQLAYKEFHKLWSAACKEPELNEYLKQSLHAEGKTEFKFEKAGLDYPNAVNLLSSIHKLSHTSFRDILEKIGKRKCEISDMYCVPIRTVEEWYTGNNKCPDYFRLILIRDFNMAKFNIKDKEVKKKKPDETLRQNIEHSSYIRDLLEKTSYLNNRKTE